MHVLRALLRWWRSPALLTAAAMGIGGAGFALGNLLLARALEPRAYGWVALALALLNLAIPVSPLGADGVVNRHAIAADRHLLGRGLLTAAACAGATGAIGVWLYGLAGDLALWIGIGVLAGGLAYLARAHLQSQRRFALSLLLTEQANWTLTLAALLALALRSESVLLPLAIVAAGHALAAALGWERLLRGPLVRPASSGYPWGESLTIAGLNAAVVLSLQLERLLIPRALDLETLAAFGVLASVTIAPFRMLQNGVSFTLLPRLRAGESHRRRRLLRNELIRVGAAAAGGSVLILWLAPFLVEALVGSKYALGLPLYVAAVVAGWVRLASAFADATATALAPASALVRLNAFGWGFVALGFAGALLGAALGELAGLIYGTSLGWAGRTLLAARLAAPHLHAAPTGAPGPHTGRLPR